jgi:aminopeptidase-like protein
MLWMLSLSTGDHSMADIARRSGLPTDVLANAIVALREADLLVPLTAAPDDAWSRDAHA